jgi:ZIP family zinc transporter
MASLATWLAGGGAAGGGSWSAGGGVWAALAASGAAGVATGVGALPLVLVRTTSDRTRSALMGFAAGVMLSAAVFSLLVPSLAQLREESGSAALAGVWATLGLLLGAGTISLVNHFAPHEHFIKGREGSDPRALRRVWLFVIAITLHNVPEGLAVGVGVGSGEDAVALPVTLGIALQNMPEGLVVALALAQEGYSRKAAIGVALLTGLVEPLGSVVGYGAVTLMREVLPWALAFAAGAMLYVVSDEIIPETHRASTAETGTWGILVGFVLMMWLDTALA